MPHVTLLTPTGRGAVATLRIQHSAILDEQPSLFVAANGRPLSQQPVGRICFGQWGHEPPEDVVACRIDADAVEIHCHGGDAAVSRIIRDLEVRHCEQRSTSTVDPESDRIEQECLTALTRATTVRTAAILWQQCEHRLSNAIAELQTLSADDSQMRVREILQWADFGSHLTQPWKVVLYGRPNVGKSSLINALVGYGRSIVFDQPGTTRDVVTADTAFDGWPIELSDTAGLREDADELETAGIVRARRRLAEADLRILLIDTSQPPQDNDRHLLDEWPDALTVAHKSDLPHVWDGELPDKAIAVSSLTNEGLNELTRRITADLIPTVPPPLTPIPICQRQIDFLQAILSPTSA